MIPGDDAKRAFDGWETARASCGGPGGDVTDNVHRRRQRGQRALCVVRCDGREGYRLWESSDTDGAERPVAGPPAGSSVSALEGQPREVGEQYSPDVRRK